MKALRLTSWTIYGIAAALLGWYALQPNDALPLVVLITFGIAFLVQSYADYMFRPAGIVHHGTFFKSISNRGIWAWTLGFVLTGMYVALYWFPEWLGKAKNGEVNTGFIHFFDPFSYALNGNAATEWFAYGTLYTYLIVLFGIRFMWKYRSERYHLRRTQVILASQVVLAYFLPEILESFSSGQAYFDKDIKNIWPLNYDFFYSTHLDNMQSSSLGMFFYVVGLAMFLIVTPVLTYYWGKRWYCSWVCGCGGLAETTGDNFRQNGPRGTGAWKVERISIHAVLVLVTIMTIATLYGYFAHTDQILGLSIYTHFQKPYGFVIGALFSGIAGVGFYPLLGTRIWCRFGCPMAAYMGIIQRFKSRFRITTNGGQCISCGNCSTYCEMGIDVRSYAQKNQSIVRASCVGCGVCASVCPRGVLKLENGPLEDRINEPVALVDYIQSKSASKS
jgi:ferredoxin-type protein NapH